MLITVFVSEGIGFNRSEIPKDKKTDSRLLIKSKYSLISLVRDYPVILYSVLFSGEKMTYDHVLVAVNLEKNWSSPRIAF